MQHPAFLVDGTLTRFLEMEVFRRHSPVSTSQRHRELSREPVQSSDPSAAQTEEQQKHTKAGV